MSFDPANWEGNGLDTDARTLLDDLECLTFEVRALYDACKREAWIHEHVARYEHGENKEFHLAVARYLWRRAQRFKEVADEMDAEMEAGYDSETHNPEGRDGT